MNFAQMLMMEVKPLSEWVIEPPPLPRSGNHTPDHTVANAAKTRRAIARYREVWEDNEWLKTYTIAHRLGVASVNISSTLRGWEGMGIIESRRVNNGSRLLEWRWK